MGINKFLLLFLILIVGGCTSYDMESLESFSDLSLKDKIVFNVKFNESVGFPIDEINVYFFDIKEEQYTSIIAQLDFELWNKYNNSEDLVLDEIIPKKYESEIQNLINKSQGYFKRVRNYEYYKEIGVFIDIQNKQLIYYIWV